MRHIPTAKFLIAVSLLASTFGASADNTDTISVGSSGQPAYAVDIETPPGIHSLKPTVSLHYTGTQSNGAVGWEWSLDATEVVTRCPSLKSIDNVRGPITYTTADHFCLNGTRLVQTDSTGNPVSVGNDASGSAAGQYVEFRAEVDPYERIRSYGYADGANASSGPAYFKVWTKDGTVKEMGAGPFGNAVSSNALIFSAHSTTAQPINYGQTWALSHVADLWGNGIDYKYAQRVRAFGSQASLTGGLEWELSEIQYANNKVIFNYVDRPLVSNGALLDASEMFTQGSRMQFVKRLSSIQEVTNSPNTTALGAAAGAVPVRNVQLAYVNSAVTNHSLLQSVKVCAGGDTSACLPETTFTYSKGGGLSYQPNAAFDTTPLGAVRLSPRVNGNNNPTDGALIADFNGDGRADVLVVDASGNTSSLYLSNGDGTFTKVPTGTGPGQYAGFNLSAWDACITPVVADFNGDGLPDIWVTTIQSRYCVNQEGHAIAQHLYLNNGDGSFTETATPPAFGLGAYMSPAARTDDGINPPVSWSIGYTFFIADVNGDGIPDLVTSIVPSSAYPSCASIECTAVYFGDGKGGFTKTTTNLAHYSIGSTSSAVSQTSSQVADIDGDGLSDLISMPDPVMQVPATIATARSRGDGNFDIIASDFCNGTLLDYNGDGVVDCLFRGYTGDTYHAATVNALYVHDIYNASPTKVSNLNYPNLLAGPGVFINTADYNGDGKGDILRIVATSTYGQTPASTSTLYLSNGDGTFSNASDSWPLTTLNYDSYFQGDFTGHGNVEFLTTCLGFNGCPAAPTGRLARLWTKTDMQPADMLMTVTSESGRKSSLEYFPLANPTFSTNTLGLRYVSDRNVSGVAAVLPTVDSIASGWAVGALTVDSGVGSGTQRTDYSYKGTKFDLTDNRFLGFREVLKQTTGADGGLLTMDSTYLQAIPYVGKPVTETLYNSALNQVATASVLKQTQTVYCDASAPSATVSAALSSGVSCPRQGVLARVYELRTTTTAKDLDGTVLPSNTQEIDGFTLDGEVSSHTETLAGTTGTHTRVTSVAFVADDTSCTAIDTCKWFLGRPDTSSMQASTTEALPSTSAGNYALATATSGTGATQAGGLTPSLVFGSVNVGNVTTLKATLVSDGVNAVSITGTPTVSGSGFSMQSTTCGATVAVDASCTVTVAFQPTAVGSATGSLSLVTGSGTLTSALTGTGGGSIATLTSTASQTFPSNWMGSASTTLSWTYRNDGNIAMTLATPVLAAPLTMTGNTCTSIAPAASCTMTATLNYGVAGLSQSQTFKPTGATTAPAVATANYSVYSAIATWSTSTLAFGNVAYGSSAQQTISVSNTGNSSINWATTTVTGATSNVTFNLSACTAVAAGASCNVVVTFAPTAVTAYNLTGLHLANASSYSNTLTVTGTGVAPALSATTPTVPNLYLGQSGTATVTLSNNGAVAAAGLATNFTGGSGGGTWALAAGGTCGTTLAAGASCTYVVNYTPVQTGSASTQFYMSTTTPGAAPNNLEDFFLLTVYPAPTFSSTVAFGSVQVGGSTTATATLTNTASAALPMTVPSASSITGTGFSFAGTTCTNSLAANSSCTVTVQYAPTAMGSNSGTLSLSTGYAALTAALSGTGTQAVLGFSPTTLAFGNIPDFTATSASVTVTNTGNVATTGLSFSPSSSSTVSGCTSIAAGGSCTLTVTVTPYSPATTAGSVGATISNGPGATLAWTATPTGANLNGYGSATAMPNSMFVGQTASASFSIINSGNVDATGVSLAFTNGSGGGNWSLGSGTTCGTTLAVGAVCTYVVQVTPTSSALGQVSSGWSVTTTTPGSTGPVSNSYVIAVYGVPTLTSSLAYGNVALNTTSTQAVTFTNTGADALPMVAPSAASVSGSGFSFAGTTCSTSLAANSSCTVSVNFTPTAISGYSGTVTLTANGANFSSSLAGTGAQASLSFSPASLPFGNVPQFTSTSLTTTVTNSGGIATSALAFTPTGGVTVSGCGSQLASGASCTLTVTVAPYSPGNISGTVVAAPGNGAGATLSWSATPVGANLNGYGSATNMPSSLFVGQTASASFSIINSGNVAANPMTFAFTNGYGGGTWSLGSGTTCGSSLAPQAVCTYVVQVTPTTAALGQVATGWQVTTTTPGSTGPVSNSYAISVYAMPTITGSLAFGNVTVNGSAAQTLTFTNSGPDAIPTVTPQISGAGFSIAATNCSTSIAANSSCTVTVNFAPTAVAGYSGAVTIGAGPGTFNTALSGTGVAVAVPVPFTADAGGTTTVFTNPNAFAATITASGIHVISGYNDASISTNTCTGSIAAHGTCTISMVAPPSDCKPDNYSVQSYVTDAGGTVYGTPVARTNSRTICP